VGGGTEADLITPGHRWIARHVGLLGIVALLALAGCAPDEQAADDTQPATTSTSSVATTTSTSVVTTAGSATTTPPDPTTTTTRPPLQGLALELVAEGFSEPVELASRIGDERIFVVQRDGEVYAVGPGGTVGEQPFADLTDVAHRGSIEQGLLGFAFHPTDPDRVFVYHSRPDNDNQLVEYRVVEDRLDPSSASVLLVIDREPDKIRHNAGHIEFGPDGLLYLSVGDGARASVNGQDPNTLLGALVRIDVDGGDPYAIPPDNPFVSGGGAPEVFVWGLRNPWRFSIDSETAIVWIGDVGQDDFEEINAAPISDPGRNFGWPIREGPVDFYGGTADTELVEPSLSLSHAETPACSITGGPVYRGVAIPEFDGRLFFADWCFGWVKSAAVSGEGLDDVVDHSDELSLSMVSTFGRDPDGEILVADFATGTIHRIVPVR
jgi:glucose/arabinose dehydrogenase